MKLQLALDMMELSEALDLAHSVENDIDIIEIGTPFILREGMRAVREFRREFPALRILADVKIMDAGKHEAVIALDAGADIITVLGVADDVTIKAVVDEAHSQGRQVMADMICVESMEKRTVQIDALGADYICAHTAFDVQGTGKAPLDELLKIQNNVKNAGAAVAGGITLSTIGLIASHKPAILIVGGGITGQPNPAAAAKRMNNIIHGKEK